MFDDFDVGAFGTVAGFARQFAVGDEGGLGAQAAEFFQGFEFVERVLGFFVRLEVGGFAFEYEEDVVAEDGDVQFVGLVRVARVFDLDVQRDVLDVRQAGGDVVGVFFKPAAGGVALQEAADVALSVGGRDVVGDDVEATVGYGGSFFRRGEPGSGDSLPVSVFGGDPVFDGFAQSSQVFVFQDFDVCPFGTVADVRFEGAVGNKGGLGAQAAEFFQGFEFVEFVLCLTFVFVVVVFGFAFEYVEGVVVQEGDVQFVVLGDAFLGVLDFHVQSDVLDAGDFFDFAEDVFFQPAAVNVGAGVFVREADAIATAGEQVFFFKEVQQAVQVFDGRFTQQDVQSVGVIFYCSRDIAVQDGEGVSKAFGGDGQGFADFLSPGRDAAGDVVGAADGVAV